MADRLSADSNQTFVMARSPRKLSNRSFDESCISKSITTIGDKPACLVNASMTHAGNDEIYLFGGFDQDSDEGGLKHSQNSIA